MRYVVNPTMRGAYIHPEVYGNFSEHLGRCIYDGVYVGGKLQNSKRQRMRTDIVEALRRMKLPVLRWPGGCFADEYHWAHGIGPKESRKKMINTHWAALWRLIPSARMNFLSFAARSAASRTLMATWVPAPCRGCRSGLNI